MGDAERLAAYDAFAEGVRAEMAEVGGRMEVLRAEMVEVGGRMEALRAQDKVKTATYRQLFATRLTLKDIDRRLADRGL